MSTVRYNPISVAFHWLMAAIIVVTWSIAIVVSDMPLSPARITGYSWHKWLGVTVFFLVILRLVWRATHLAPQLEIKMPVWQERAMQLTHFALYLLMMVIPLVGWLMSSAKGYTVNYFGLFELPDLLSKDKALGHQLKDLHEYLADILVALVCLHVLAALKHQFIDKDGLLSRMSFCSCSKKKD
ncbi:cytochrome b [Polynucleobacter sphagniphilus]|uniref:cytochrome b n=2 Tax=Polynucleobacter sphagniphilus TaxID=1743169 RepID=UPI00096B721E|nr:cytochrome b [Polynucleobacter sphagniphilus]OLY96290.1 cytochrome b [Polynucleobacter sphagniphilus]